MAVAGSVVDGLVRAERRSLRSTSPSSLARRTRRWLQTGGAIAYVAEGQGNVEGRAHQAREGKVVLHLQAEGALVQGPGVPSE